MKARKRKKMTTKQVARLKVSHKKHWVTCTLCTNELYVDENVLAIKCSTCTAKMAPVPKKLLESKKKSEKPAGWRFMASFVDKDGNVFHFGEEQKELKGTLEPSDVDKIRAEQKKKREENKKKKVLREKLKQQRLIKQYEKKQKSKRKAKSAKKSKVNKDSKKQNKKVKTKKMSKSNVKYEKFEESKTIDDNTQIGKFLETESEFYRHLQKRMIRVADIKKISRNSYAAIDKQTGIVKNKRRGYKVNLSNGETKIININLKLNTDAKLL